MFGSQPALRVPLDLPQVEVEVESMDKAGNFIGWLHTEGLNLSVALVEHALSKVHFTAERSPYYKALLAAEEAAKQKKEKVSVGRARPRGCHQHQGCPQAKGRPHPKGCPQSKRKCPHLKGHAKGCLHAEGHSYPKECLHPKGCPHATR